MKYRLEDLIDIAQFQSLQDRLSAIYPFPCALLDNEGQILTATAWQDICTTFHRQNKECEKACLKSDQYILEHLGEANPAVIYRCPHGLIDCAMPIIVEGQHVGNFFTGQFFMEEPGLDFFKQQAAKYGFDEDAYLQAVQRVPIWEEKQLNSYLLFVKEMLDVLSSVALGKLKEIEAGKAQRESEERFRLLFEQAGDYILLLGVTEDEGLVVVDANQAACKIHGYAREEFIGMSIRDVDRALNETQVRALLERLMSGESILFETAHAKKDGTIFPVEVSSSLLDTGQDLPLLTSIERDITERKRAEEQLRESEKKLAESNQVLAGVLEHTHMLAVFMDPRFDFIWVNRAYADSCRREPSFFPGKNHFGLYPHEENQAIFQRVVDTGEQFFVAAKPFEFPDQPERGVTYWDWSLIPVKGDDGKVAGLVFTLAEVTERIRAEEARSQLEAQMQQTQKLESLGVMAGGIAHDFNNILYTILGNAEIAAGKMAPEAPGHEHLKEIQVAATRAAGLTDQMLAYSGTGALALEEIDLSRLVKEMAHLLEVSHTKKSIVKYRFDAELPAVLGDASQLRQIVMNLITNASEAVGDEGGLITVTTGVTEATPAYLAATFVNDALPGGHYVYLEVIDTGCGMDEEMQRRMFEPFFTTKFTGRGLGMAAVLGILRAHHGAIDIDSEVGRGTTIRVLLPALDAPAKPLSGEPREEADWRGEGTVLVVDDEDQVRTLQRLALEQKGFTVLTAVDGCEAVEVFKEHQDDIVCVLLDLTMPRMGGEETFAELRRVRNDVPVILVSGYSEEEVKERIGDLGFSGLLKKPVRTKVLFEKIQSVLRAEQ